MSFEKNWWRVADIEGGYVDDPHDSGGATRYGVTEQLARQYGYEGSMRRLPKNKATQIAKEEFWDKMLLDGVEAIFPLVAAEMFDTAYNVGHERAARFLQRSLNGLNRRGRDYDDLVVDGIMGRRTLGALEQYGVVRNKRGELVLFKALDCLQGAFYITLVERREKDEKFLFGWLDHRVGLHS